MKEILCYLDRPPRNKTARSGADDSASIDDGVSTCSNISDLTSIYEDSEGKIEFEIYYFENNQLYFLLFVCHFLFLSSKKNCGD